MSSLVSALGYNRERMLRHSQKTSNTLGFEGYLTLLTGADRVNENISAKSCQRPRYSQILSSCYSHVGYYPCSQGSCKRVRRIYWATLVPALMKTSDHKEQTPSPKSRARAIFSKQNSP